MGDRENLALKKGFLFRWEGRKDSIRGNCGKEKLVVLISRKQIPKSRDDRVNTVPPVG
jgi:hypothetical protein